MNTTVTSASFRQAKTTIGTIWDLAGEQRSVLLRSIGFKMLQAVCEAAPAAVLVLVVNEIRLDTLNESGLLTAVAVLGGCLCGQMIFGYWSNRSAWIATFGLFAGLRARMLNHVRRLPMSFHDNQASGDTVTVLTQDVSSVENFTHEPLQQMIGAAIAPLVVFVVLLFQDVPMALAAMSSVVLAIPAFVWSNAIFVKLARERQTLQASATSRIIEYLQGIAVVRAFGLAGEKLASLREALGAFHNISARMARQLAPLNVLFLSIVFLGIPLVLFLGSYWLLGGTLDAGVFLIFAVLSLRIYLPLAAAAQGFESMRIADASLDRIAALMDVAPEPESDGSATARAPFDVRFESVDFAYNDASAVIKNASFVARQGEVTALVGPSGSGKSTLLQLVAGLRRPNSGQIVLGGADQSRLPQEELFALVTPVFQDVYLFPGTIRDNIAFGREQADDNAIITAARRAQAHEFIMRMPKGYDTPVEESGSSLSGGERQRIAIARAVLKDSPIILLDEVTSALDASNERRVQEGLAALVANKTVLVVAHRLATIEAAHQILVTENGQITASGTHKSLLAESATYRKLWDARRQASEWTVRNSDQ